MAREGLVRAYFCDHGVGFEAGKWAELWRLYRRMMGLVLSRKSGHAEVSESAKGPGQITKITVELTESEDNATMFVDLKMAKCRVVGLVVSRTAW
jgi:hypothetical protein